MNKVFDGDLSNCNVGLSEGGLQNNFLDHCSESFLELSLFKIKKYVK